MRRDTDGRRGWAALAGRPRFGDAGLPAPARSEADPLAEADRGPAVRGDARATPGAGGAGPAMVADARTDGTGRDRDDGHLRGTRGCAARPGPRRRVRTGGIGPAAEPAR